MSRLPTLMPKKFTEISGRSTAFALLLLLLNAGCWNGDVSNVSLPDVSLGTQLIDLKRALEEDAISQEEYETTRENLIALYETCENGQDD